MTPQQIKSFIRTIADYPKPGIQFRDVTTLMQSPEAFKSSINLLAEHFSTTDFDYIVGTEARGFIFGAPLAYAMNVGFIPVRKPNKLPGKVISEHYDLEYGQDTLQMHSNAISKGNRVLMVDDLLATGGTMLATANLIRQLGGIVEHAAFVVALPELNGEARLEASGVSCYSICQFDGE